MTNHSESTAITDFTAITAAAIEAGVNNMTREDKELIAAKADKISEFLDWSGAMLSILIENEKRKEIGTSMEGILFMLAECRSFSDQIRERIDF